MSFFNFPTEEEEKDYYEKAEKAVHDMPKYGYPGENRPHYQGPKREKPGCPLMLLVLASPFILGAIAIAQLL